MLQTELYNSFLDTCNRHESQFSRCNERVFMHVQDGKTALFIASLKGHADVVKLLLQKKADVHICKEVC